MLITRSPCLTLRQVAEREGVHRCTVQSWIDFEGLCAIRDERGHRYIREAELDRFLAERSERQAARRAQAALRRQERQERRQRWLARLAAEHGLVRAGEARSGAGRAAA